MSEAEPLIYDYIICGGGTSGCVVAGRLAEAPSISVLVLEAGQHCSEYPAIAIPGASGSLFGTEADWNIISEPCAKLNDRSIPLIRGKFLGGSSGLNGTLCIRGTKQDYDEWNIPGWGGEEFFSYMAKAENFVSKPWFESDPKTHGTDGLIQTSPSEIAPISKLLLEAFQSKGLPLVPDMFSTGEIPHGCGYAVRSVRDGVRSTAASYVLNDNVQDRVTIKTNTLVDKLLFERNGDERRAIGVEVIMEDGSKKTFLARKEVIISAGPYCSPGILLRSGIGCRKAVEDLGVTSVIDLPGVGKNLMDHVIVWIFYEVTPPNLTLDHILTHPGKRSEAIKSWMKDHTGPLSNFPFGVFAFARLDKRLSDSTPRKEGRDAMNPTPQQPHVEFFNTEAYGGAQATSPLSTESAFAMLVNLSAPKSRGVVKLKSSDAREKPVVDHGYLSEEIDVLVLAEGCKFANEIVMHGDGMRDVVTGSWPGGEGYCGFGEREEWVDFVRERATTSYHPAGTCKMGDLETDPMAVVDKELRVFGVSNLRVVDTSIIPILPSGHLQMPAYGIGEKAADMIKAAS